MRHTRFTFLTAALFVLACSTEDQRLGGNQVNLDPDSGAGTGGEAGSAGIGGDGGTSGSSGTTSLAGAGGAVAPAVNLHTAFIDLVIPQSDGCMPRRLNVEIDGRVPCSIVQSTSTDCGCTRPGFRPAKPALLEAARRELEIFGSCGVSGAPACDSICLCELEQADGEALTVCLAGDPMAVDGWCYIDPSWGAGDAALVANCPPQAKRKLRFKNETAEPGQHTFIACSIVESMTSLVPLRSGEIGDACIPAAEQHPDFSAFGFQDVNVEVGSRDCASRVCLANHFQGRVSCPYGQAPGESNCTVTWAESKVAVPVIPQMDSRRGADVVTCSCRCAGPGPGPFCTCPDGYQCEELIGDFGVGASEIAGSYCVKPGTEFTGIPGAECDRAISNCE